MINKEKLLVIFVLFVLFGCKNNLVVTNNMLDRYKEIYDLTPVSLNESLKTFIDGVFISINNQKALVPENYFWSNKFNDVSLSVIFGALLEMSGSKNYVIRNVDLSKKISISIYGVDLNDQMISKYTEKQLTKLVQESVNKAIEQLLYLFSMEKREQKVLYQIYTIKQLNWETIEASSVKINRLEYSTGLEKNRGPLGNINESEGVFYVTFKELLKAQEDYKTFLKINTNIEIIDESNSTGVFSLPLEDISDGYMDLNKYIDYLRKWGFELSIKEEAREAVVVDSSI